MVRHIGASNPDLDAALDDAACLGAWSFDTDSRSFSCSQKLSRKLGFAGKLQQVAPLACFLAAIHDEDRARVENQFHVASELGGSIEVEFRTSMEGRVPLWLRLMGRTGAHPTSSAARLRGLAFDLTEGRRSQGSPAQQAQDRINQLADHAIAMKSLVAGLENSPLSRLVDRVAIEIGFELARRLSQSDPVKRH